VVVPVVGYLPTSLISKEDIFVNAQNPV